MKTIFSIFISVLFVGTSFAATPTSIGMRSYSSATATNYATTCSVISGKINDQGIISVNNLVSYDMSKGGTNSFTPVSGQDYRIDCVQTASPQTAYKAKIFFNGSEVYTFPTSSLLLRF